MRSLLLLAAVFLASCDSSDGPPPPPPPELATLRISLDTSGSDVPDPIVIWYWPSDCAISCMRFLIEGAPVELELPAGSQSLAVLDVPLNCTLSGENPRTITLEAGATHDVSYSMSCRARAMLRIVINSARFEPGSFMVRHVTGCVGEDPTFGCWRELPTETERCDTLWDPCVELAPWPLVLGPVREGPHEWELEQVPAGCTGVGQRVAVLATSGETKDVVFGVSC